MMVSKPTALWVRYDCPAIAEALGLSERTVWRAKAYLMEHADYYGLAWITHLVKGESAHWRVLVALQSRLKYDRLPLFVQKDGQTRHLKSWIRAAERLDPVSHSGLEVADLRARGETDRPGAYEEGDTQQFSKPDESGRPLDAESAVGHQLESGRIWRWRAGTTDAQRRRYAASIAQCLGRQHWDNCKVRFVKSATISVVLSLLNGGVCPAAIISEYAAKLSIVHADAVDSGLNEGCPTRLIFPLTLFAALYRECGFEAVHTDAGTMYLQIHDEVLPGLNGKWRRAWYAANGARGRPKKSECRREATPFTVDAVFQRPEWHPEPNARSWRSS